MLVSVREDLVTVGIKDVIIRGIVTDMLLISGDIFSVPKYAFLTVIVAVRSNDVSNALYVN